MFKTLVDGSLAVGLFNRGKEATELSATWKELKILGVQTVRDLWHEKEIGLYADSLTVTVPPQGVVMVKITKK